MLRGRIACFGLLVWMFAVPTPAAAQAGGPASLAQSQPAPDPGLPTINGTTRGDVQPVPPVIMPTSQATAAKRAVFAPTGNMWFHGGNTIQKNPKVWISFWGTEWQSGFNSGGATNTQVINYVLTYFGGVGGSSWAGVNTQYCDNVPRNTFFCSTVAGAHFIGNPAGQFQGAFIDTNGVPGTPNAIDMGLAANRLRAAALGALNNDSDADFMVFLPPGHGDTQFVAKGGPACAWHSWFPFPFSPGVAFTTIPYQLDAPNNCGANSVNGTNDGFGHGLLDGFSIVAGHEYAEVVTDAFMDPVFSPPLFGGWMDNDGLTGETGDKCAWTMLDNVRIGSSFFAVQPLWSNNAGGCTTSSSPSISLSPSSLNFGKVLVGASSGTQTVTVTNPGTADLHISGVSYGGSNPGDFQDMGSNCAFKTIHPVSSSSCTLATRFRPTTTGLRTADIQVNDDAGGPHFVNLQGFGQQLSVTLAPVSASNVIDNPHTLTATVADNASAPQPGINVTFKITSGPNQAAHTGTDISVTDASGHASVTYTSAVAGVDTWVASFVDVLGNMHTSNPATKTWTLPPAANLTLSPKTATNTVGTQHCVIALVTDASGKPLPNVTVTFSATGANAAAGVAVTDNTGQAKFCYTGTKSGTDTITATAAGGTNPSDTASKTWTAAAPATLVLTPKTATNTVGTSHTVTATVRDAFGNPVPGAIVTFTVTGANSAGGSAVTNASGQATFTYTGTNFGTDAITASASPTVKDTAAKIWILAALDHFKCYSVQTRGGGHEDSEDTDLVNGRRIVTLTDEFGSARVTVGKPTLLCNPADKNGSGIVTPTAHLVGYQIDSLSESKDRFAQVKNQFGTETLTVKDPAILAEPASKAAAGQVPGPVPITLNNFECYKVEGRAPKPTQVVTLKDQFGTERVTVGHPVLVCNPAQKNDEKIGPVPGPAHLVCYSVQPHKRMRDMVVQTRDQFGTQTLRVIISELLCVPSDERAIPKPQDNGEGDAAGNANGAIGAIATSAGPRSGRH